MASVRCAFWFPFDPKKRGTPKTNRQKHGLLWWRFFLCVPLLLASFPSAHKSHGTSVFFVAVIDSPSQEGKVETIFLDDIGLGEQTFSMFST